MEYGAGTRGTEENSGPGNFVVVAWPYENLSSQLSLSSSSYGVSISSHPPRVHSVPFFFNAQASTPAEEDKGTNSDNNQASHQRFLPSRGHLRSRLDPEVFLNLLGCNYFAFWCIWNSIDMVGKEKCCPLQGMWISGSSRLSFISIFLSYGLFTLVFDFEANAAGDSLID